MKAISSLLARFTALLCLGTGSANAAVNLLFSGVPRVASNWLDASGYDGTTGNFSFAFTGPDAPKPMTYRLVPEPGAVLLATLSCAALAIRRKR